MPPTASQPSITQHLAKYAYKPGNRNSTDGRKSARISLVKQEPQTAEEAGEEDPVRDTSSRKRRRLNASERAAIDNSEHGMGDVVKEERASPILDVVGDHALDGADDRLTPHQNVVTPKSTSRLTSRSSPPLSRQPGEPDLPPAHTTNNPPSSTRPIPSSSTLPRKTTRTRSNPTKIKVEDLSSNQDDDSDVPTRKAIAKGKAKQKNKKIPRPYAGPEVYAHLPHLPDRLKEGLDVLFCGINPGKMSAATGHHFANPTNKFWLALHNGGFTDIRYKPSDDALMPEKFNFGLTNLVPRPTSEQAELSSLEMRLCVPSFLDKVTEYKPRLVCFVGKKIWDEFEWVIGKCSREAEVGWRDMDLDSGEVAGNVDGVPGNMVKTEGEPGDESRAVAEAIPSVINASNAALSQPRQSLTGDHKPAMMTSKDGKPITVTPRKGKRSIKTPFNWEQPRGYKLVYGNRRDELGDRSGSVSDGGSSEDVTLFWTVPSTSGLERTKREVLWTYFARCKRMSGKIGEGNVDLRMFKEIDAQAVRTFVEGLRKAKG